MDAIPRKLSLERKRIIVSLDAEIVRPIERKGRTDGIAGCTSGMPCLYILRPAVSQKMRDCRPYSSSGGTSPAHSHS